MRGRPYLNIPSPGPLLLRVVAGALGVAAVLGVFGALLTSAADRPAHLVDRVAIWVASGLLYVGVMTPVARRAAGGRGARFVTVLIPLYLTGAVGDLVEAYFYTTVLSPGLLVAAVLVELVPVALIALAVVLAIPPSTRRPPAPAFRSQWHERSAWSWCWRILLAGVPYALIYLLFAELVTPIEHAYYYDASFVASLHTRVPPTGVTLALEAFRGVLFVLAALPVLAVFRDSRRAAFWQVAAIGAVVEAYVPLLGRFSWPLGMRLGNVLELTGDSLARAGLMVLVVALPPVVASRRAG